MKNKLSLGFSKQFGSAKKADAVIDAYKKELAKKKRPFKAIHYFPVDSYLRKDWFKDIEAVDKLITNTNYGVSEFAKFSNVKVDVLPHGIDLNIFKPVSADEKKELRKKHFEGLNEVKNLLFVMLHSKFYFFGRFHITHTKKQIINPAINPHANNIIIVPHISSAQSLPIVV